ncbi:hypothetical protein Belba_3654 [Belliella baltica DSM 15883]|uniref:Uncharacterized protein n=1 Tax=Belliella baltica (strain DSM 15883 / CIP 108006 / LMG 21964 / BA134) TaxID=866536 RepID=I3ZA77_BELBD|nr:hypothetical protein [Belliella baltica]AFL86145.1 hypothetical protein Belba_3654 [Belliella baltica DSM 15883]
MNKTEEKIKALASENPVSRWREKVEFRKANKSRLKNAAKAALRVLDALDQNAYTYVLQLKSSKGDFLCFQ